MGLMAGRAMPLLNRLVDMGLLEQCLCLLVTGIAECAVRHEGLVRVIRGMGAMAGQATAFLNRTVNMGLSKGRFTFGMAGVTELRPLLLDLQGLGRFRRVVACTTLILIEGLMDKLTKQFGV